MWLRRPAMRLSGLRVNAEPVQASGSNGGATMPAKTEKQRRFMGAELQRKREGRKTRTDMSEAELEKMASKPDSKKQEPKD